MALFKTKKNISTKTEEIPREVSIKKVENKSVKKLISTAKKQGGHLFSVLKYSRVTEKATDLSQNHNTYVFEVDKNTNKREIIKAIKMFYNITPKKIRIVKIPSKNVISRGKKGVKSGGKKAYVYLKKDDKLEII